MNTMEEFFTKVSLLMDLAKELGLKVKDDLQDETLSLVFDVPNLPFEYDVEE